MIEGKFSGGVVVLQEPHSLREGEPVSVSPVSAEDDSSPPPGSVEAIRRFFEEAEPMDDDSRKEWDELGRMIQAERDADALRLARQWRNEGVALHPDVEAELDRLDAEEAARARR